MTRHKRAKTATFLQALVVSYGPQLLLFRTDTASLIVAVAVADNAFSDPFFGAEIDRDQFYEYIGENFDLRFVMSRPAYGKWYIIDFAHMSDTGIVGLKSIKLTSDLRNQYMPGRGIFAREHTEQINDALQPNLTEEKIFIDGSWDLPDFSHFYGKYTDLYVFYNSIDRFVDEQEEISERRKVQEAFIRPWQGGGSYGAFYGSLLKAQNRAERLRVKAIAYESPGHVRIEGRLKPFNDLRKLISHFDENKETVGIAYNEFHSWLSKMQLLTLSADSFDNNNDLASEVAFKASLFSEVLAAADYGTIYTMSGNNHLIAAKVLLSVERRLQKLNEFFLQGRVSLS